MASVLHLGNDKRSKICQRTYTPNPSTLVSGGSETRKFQKLRLQNAENPYIPTKSNIAEIKTLTTLCKTHLI